MVVATSVAAPAVLDTGVGVYALSEGVHSERTSSTLSGPGTPRGLQTLLEVPYDPLKEPYARYEKRVNRVVLALSMLEIHIDDVTVRSLLWDAEITAQVHSFGDEQQMAWLKRAFGQILTASDDLMDDKETSWRLDVVSRRLKEKGFNTPSRYVAKIAAGSPPSYAGTPFPFSMKAGATPARVPMMPLNLYKKLEGNERVVTPRGRKQPEAPSLSPSIAGSAQEAVQAAILERLDRMQQNVHSSANTNEGLMASACAKQPEMMEKVVNTPTDSRRSLIRSDTTGHWTSLTNSDCERA